MAGGQRRDLIALDEAIARQRFNLNQTIRVETRSKVKLDLAQVEKLAAFENKLAIQTHELVEFLAGLGVDGAAILAQAEEAMLSAVDSLNDAKFPTAINQQRDALRYLMEARETARRNLYKQPPKVLAQIRQFDRLQRQRLRRPNDQAQSLAQLASDLGKLADAEEAVARDITGPAPAGKPDPALPKQDEIAGEAIGIDKAAANMKGLTGLAKTRIGEATKAANNASDALGQGDRETARKEVDRAKELFRAAAKQVSILAAEEAAQQLAAARDLANELSAMVAPTDPMKNPGIGAGGDGKLPGLGTAVEKAKTLKDVLDNLAASGNEGDAEVARKVAGLLRQEDLKAAIDRLEKLGAGDKGERQDLADRFAAFGQKLDQTYREAVAPRLEEIAKFEREANELEQRAGTADDAADFRRLRQQVADFVQRLDDAGLGHLAGEDLRSALKGNAVGNRDSFVRGLAFVRAGLIAKLQDLTGDRFTTGNEAVPPEYKDLVERYLRTLSGGGGK